MEVEVIQRTVSLKAVEAEVEVLRKDGCDKAKESKESIVKIEKSINEIKEQIGVSK